MEITIPIYEALNCLLTGLLFVVFNLCLINICEIRIIFIPLDFIKNLPNTVTSICCIAIFYECGFVINRIGSIVTENILYSFRILPFNHDYVLYNESKKKYPILDTLSRNYSVARTQFTLYFILFVESLVSLCCCFLEIGQFSYNVLFALIWFIPLIIILVIIFYYSCYKYATKIVSLMKKEPARG